MTSYLYKCFKCNKEFNANEIEDNFIYLCPGCGKAEKNKPLEGVLLIEYDYDEIKKKISREKFLENTPGKFYLYPYLFPIEYSGNRINKISDSKLQYLTLNENPVLYSEEENIFFMDETRNPTFSFKDRASILVAVKAIQKNIKEISAASTGNAGSSLAGICARLGLESHLFVPKNIPEAKRIQIQSYGANIYVVAGSYDSAFDLCTEVSQKKNWFNRNTAYNSLTIEGKKSAAYDIFISLKGKLPERIFIPVGDGVIISGIYKGFNELLKLGWIEKLPELIAVQAEGSNAVVKYLKEKNFEFNPANTIADSISAGAPRNLYMAVDAIEKSNGKGIEVSDEEIIDAQKALAQKHGFLVEPSSAAAYAGYLKFKSTYENSDNALILLTGSGLKDFASLTKWNKPPEAKTYDEWMEIF